MNSFNQYFGEGKRGGKSDDMSLVEILNHHKKKNKKVTLADLKKELNKGIKVEFEHTNSRSEARRIAMDHLVEMPDYYSKLDTIEEH